MSKYKGLFTFDENSHRYVPIAQADGIIDTMDYEPDSNPAEPLIKDEKIREVVRAWANVNGFHEARYSSVNNCFCHQGEMLFVEPTWELEQLDNLGYKTIAELCGEEEE